MNTQKELNETAAKLEAAGEYADAAIYRAAADNAALEGEAMPRTAHDLLPGGSFTEPDVNEYDTQAEKFLSDNGLKFRATLSDTKTAPWSNGDGEAGRHYRVTISRDFSEKNRPQSISRADWKKRMESAQGSVKSRLVFDFWGSIADARKGIKTERPYSVLASISGEVHCPETFKDFCGEYGYESDSIKALQTFRRCSAFAKRLRAFFTEAELAQLSEIQ